MRNDETLCSADDLSVYQKSSEQFAQCLAEHGSIDVQEGDWIRIVADARPESRRRRCTSAGHHI